MSATLCWPEAAALTTTRRKRARPQSVYTRSVAVDMERVRNRKPKPRRDAAYIREVGGAWVVSLVHQQLVLRRSATERPPSDRSIHRRRVVPAPAIELHLISAAIRRHADRMQVHLTPRPVAKRDSIAKRR